MQILTPTGYVNPSTLSPGDQVIGLSGSINTIITIDAWTSATDPYNQGSFDFYLINGTWNLYKNQSIVANNNIVHAFELNVGDTVYDSNNNSITITSIVMDTDTVWYRLELSGDHTYISDNLLLHNASRFWVGGGSSVNWNATANTNWGATSGGPNNSSVPGAADSVTFDNNSNSPSTISAIITILSFTNTTGFTNTITTNAILSIAGSVTTATGINWAGTAAWNITAASTFTSGGVTFVPPLTTTNSILLTLSGALSVSGLFTHVTGNLSLTGSNVTLSGGLTVNNAIIPQQVNITLTGGTWSGAAGIGAAGTTGTMSLAGNVVVSGSVGFATGGLQYTSGNITTAGSTLVITGATIFNTAGMTWSNINFAASAIASTLISNLACSNVLEWSATTAVNHTTAETITTSGGISTVSSSAGIGSATVIVTGGTWSSTGGAFAFRNPLTLNGNIVVSGGVDYASGTLTYQSGTITTAGSTLTVNAASTLNTAGIIWNNVAFTAAATYTLQSNLTCNGLLTLGSAAAALVFSGTYSMIANGGVTFASTTAPTTGASTTLFIQGGNVTPGNSTGTVEIPIMVQGNVTWLTGYLPYGNNTLTFQSGTQTFNSGAGIYFRVVGGATFSNNIANLSGVGVKFDAAETYIISGSYGIGFTDFNVLLNGSSATNISLLYGNSYSMSSSLVSSMTGTINTVVYPTIKSSSPGNMVPFALLPQATQHLERINFTDIDASSGQTILDYSPNVTPITLSNTLNINTTPTTNLTTTSVFTN
jgi:hypothetical protein